MKRGKPKKPIDQLDLGPVSTGWLHEIGIFTRGDLEKTGSAAAYLALKRLYPKRVSLNLLWGLEAALMEIHWTELPNDVKARLKKEVSFDC